MSCFEAEEFCVREQATAFFRATILDQNKLLLPASALQTLTLTLYRKGDPTAIVNLRDDQDVLNANGVDVYETLQTDPDGTTYNLKWEISPDDNTILGTSAEEKHVALFRYSWNAGQRADWREVILLVQNQAVIA